MARGYWVFEDDYKHYRNFAVGGTVFATTTVLDHTPVFADSAVADLMTASLISDCAYYGAKLWALVVMPTHIHLLVDLKEGQAISAFMDRLKTNSAFRIGASFKAYCDGLLEAKRDPTGPSFWQTGFRSVSVGSRSEFAVKVRYVHSNPVKAGICIEPFGYRWSSAWMCNTGYATWESGIVLPGEVRRGFADEAALSLKRRPCV